MLVRMAEAIGRIVLAGREMTRLAGLVLVLGLIFFFFFVKLIFTITGICNFDTPSLTSQPSI